MPIKVTTRADETGKLPTRLEVAAPHAETKSQLREPSIPVPIGNRLHAEAAIEKHPESHVERNTGISIQHEQEPNMYGQSPEANMQRHHVEHDLQHQHPPQRQRQPQHPERNIHGEHPAAKAEILPPESKRHVEIQALEPPRDGAAPSMNYLR